MIFVRLDGGLGNIMFQYALGRNLSIKNNTDLRFDINSYKTNPVGDYSFALEAFKIKIKEKLATTGEITWFEKFKRKPGKIWFLYNKLIADKTKYVQEKQFHFDPEILKSGDNVYLKGWWQTEKYFIDIRKTLLEDFTVKSPLSGKNKDVTEKISKTNSISVHIRRLDYVNNPRTRHFHGELNQEYYDKAMELIGSKVKTPVFFVFSDDAKWVKENMKFPSETTFIDWNAQLPHEDVRLMSLCKHNIIANSTLGWWGAWLNQNKEKIVIAPKVWFANPKPSMNTKDVIPDSWLKI